MEDPKDGVLPLVGRVIKKRLSELKEETTRELREGYDEFREELRRDLQGSAEEAEEPPLVRVSTEEK
jgi:hypothetical protein